MKNPMRWIAALVGVGAVVVLFVLLRPDGSGTDRSTSGASPMASAGANGAKIRVAVAGDEIDVTGDTTVKQGTDVRIVVEADVADEVHLHGYDLMDDVGPGEPAEIQLEAVATGVFEVELEDAGRLLFELTVEP